MINRERSLLLCAAAVCAMLAGGCSAGGPVAGQASRINDMPAFQTDVLASTQPVMLEFNKNNCPACMFFAPTFADLAGEYQGRARFITMEYHDADRAGLLGQYHVDAFPTVVMLVGGKEQARWVGLKGKEPYRHELDRVTR